MLFAFMVQNMAASLELYISLCIYKYIVTGIIVSANNTSRLYPVPVKRSDTFSFVFKPFLFFTSSFRGRRVLMVREPGL